MSYTTEMIEKILTSEQAKLFINKMTPIYGEAYVFLCLLQSIGIELDNLMSISEDLRNQVIPQTATWTLDNWEKEYNIQTSDNMTTEERQQNLLNVLTANINNSPKSLEKLLQNITYDNAGYLRVVVKEKKGSTFDVKVINENYNLGWRASKLINIVNERKPAHLIANIVCGEDIDLEFSTYRGVAIFEKETCKVVVGKYIVHVIPDQEDAIVTLSYNNVLYDNNYIIVPNGGTLSYIVEKPGYKKVSETITVTGNTTINITMKKMAIETVNLSYPFDTSYLENLVTSNGDFIIDDTLQAIVSGSTSHNVNNGTSYGYIKITTPSSDVNGILALSVTVEISSEEDFDYGGLYLGKAIYTPTQSQIEDETTDGNGVWIFAISGSSENTYTYEYEIEPNTDYYLNFAYAKDSSVNENDDKLIIKNINITTMF